MAFYNIDFFSQSLVRPVNFKMFLPNDINPGDSIYYRRPMRTLFLLHGYTGAANYWGVENLAMKYNFATVMPNGENSFYLDTAMPEGKYCTFVGEELPHYLRKTFGLANSADDTYIMGMSMGGFGALHTALCYPDSFGKVGAMSSALIIDGIAGMKEGEDNGVSNYAYYRHYFGDLDKVKESRNNPEVLVRELLSATCRLPEIYMCCGTEDFLLEPNKAFHNFLTEQGYSHIYKESPGEHNDAFWDDYKKLIIEWMMK